MFKTGSANGCNDDDDDDIRSIKRQPFDGLDDVVQPDAGTEWRGGKGTPAQDAGKRRCYENKGRRYDTGEGGNRLRCPVEDSLVRS